tara:strand:- start:41582 stop:43021 length:1440 start_codon:yes stop_codon:yes gene_type:complete
MLWTTIAILLLVLGFIAILWSCFWDRPGRRGRPTNRCPKCWYDITNAGDYPITCPECGKVSETKKSTTRTRRHKRVAFLGLLLILAAPIAFMTPQYRQGTLFASLPNWVLIEILPFFPTIQDDNQLFIKGNSPGVELVTRVAVGGDRFTHEQAVDFINRTAEGNIFAPPGSRAWQDTTAIWLRGQMFRFGNDTEGWHYPDKAPADQKLLDAIAKLQAVLFKWYPETRTHWPAGHMILIQSGLGNPYWKNNLELQEHQEVQWKVRGTNQSGTNFHGGYFAIPNDYPTGEQLTIDLTYRLYRSPLSQITEESKGEPIDEHHAVLKTTIVESIDDVIRSVESKAIESILIEEFIPSLPQEQIHTIVFQNPAFKQSILKNLGMGLRIKLFDADDPIVEYTPNWMCRKGKLSSMSAGQNEYVPIDEVELRIQDAVKNNTLRITIVSDPAMLLDNPDVHRAWAGSIDILYTDAIKQAEGSKKADE